MPNHVTNILVVSGDEKQRQAMFEAIKSVNAEMILQENAEQIM